MYFALLLVLSHYLLPHTPSLVVPTSQQLEFSSGTPCDIEHTNRSSTVQVFCGVRYVHSEDRNFHVGQKCERYVKDMEVALKDLQRQSGWTEDVREEDIGR